MAQVDYYHPCWCSCTCINFRSADRSDVSGGRIRNMVIWMWLPMSVCLPSFSFSGWLFCWVKTCGEGGKEFRRRGEMRCSWSDVTGSWEDVWCGKVAEPEKTIGLLSCRLCDASAEHYYLSRGERQVSHSLDKQWMILEEQPEDEALTLCSFTFLKHRNRMIH